MNIETSRFFFVQLWRTPERDPSGPLLELPEDDIAMIGSQPKCLA